MKSRSGPCNPSTPYRFWRAAIGVLLVVFSTHSRAGDCPLEFRKLERTLEWNQFVTGRDLSEYRHHFGTAFSQALRELRPEDHWIDFGAGRGVALLDHHREVGALSPRMTGVVYSTAWFAGRALKKWTSEGGGRFRYLAGRYAEDIPDLELGRARMITDLFGPVAYSSRIEEVINKYLRLLEVGGKAHLIWGARTAVVDRAGTRQSLGLWLKKQFPESEFRLSEESGIGSVLIEKLRESSFQIPNLKLKSLKSDQPPIRLFEE